MKLNHPTQAPVRVLTIWLQSASTTAKIGAHVRFQRGESPPWHKSRGDVVMRLITFARLLLWLGCIGSLAFFLFFVIDRYKVPIAAYIPSDIPVFLRDGDTIRKFADQIKSISDIWQGVSAALVGLGAIIARRQNTVDKGLNGDWFWVSNIQKNKIILRVAWGEISINDIH